MIDFDYFALFGVAPAFTQDLPTLKARYLELQQTMHPDNFVNALAHERQLAISYAAAVNDAIKVLSCPLQRAIYLLKIKGVDTQSETDTQMPMAFLAEQMELREQLMDISDESERITLENKINDAWQVCEKGLTETLDATQTDLPAARLWVRKMQFYARLREEVQLCLC
ncbi:MAG TPA: Fe-S protein assembly co-chaperone HscB [Candidatus Berkiella sp.]|nr:Fe-S protein assembly co-chaperone HscB [Candidatus Berkiella sp.]